MSPKYYDKPSLIKSLSYKSNNNDSNILKEHAQNYKISKQRIDQQAKNFDEFQDLRKTLIDGFILGFKYNYNFDEAV